MDPEMIILFIGGPFDGKRKRWGANQPVQKVLTLTLEAPIEGFYRIETFRSETGRKYMAVHEGVHDVMQLLMDGYRRVQ
jgi:hypothetical protein